MILQNKHTSFLPKMIKTKYFIKSVTFQQLLCFLRLWWLRHGRPSDSHGIVKVALKGNKESKNSQYKYLHLLLENEKNPSILTNAFIAKCWLCVKISHLPKLCPKTQGSQRHTPNSTLCQPLRSIYSHTTQEMLPSKVLAAIGPNKSSKDIFSFKSAAFVYQRC